MKIIIQKDNQKAKALRKLAEITLERINESDKKKYAALIISDYYDSLHKLLEAITLSKGIKIKGKCAHRELINTVANEGHITEKERHFLQNLRDLRNKINYE